MTKLFIHYGILLTILSCQALKGGTGYGSMAGTTGVFEGNCMPSPGVAPCKPRPVSTTVFITRKAKEFEWSLLIDSVVSDSNGLYNIRIFEGNYSLFLRDGNKIICTGYQCDPECHCSPVTIFADSVSLINLNLDHANW
ncbi:MAG: hypothetical protein RIM99_16095 [Cyclobacteriaceae bacterium]